MADGTVGIELYFKAARILIDGALDMAEGAFDSLDAITVDGASADQREAIAAMRGKADAMHRAMAELLAPEGK